ncbi:hypothetical protein [Mesonia aquimarina]|uniref:hypothetical protein n=1 Tax=Mesonia aquimarina TaxID=1504967 RepID=UPI000EF5B31B|nr:hypothetical protein [Mesonia aquimarina]
MKKTLQYIFSTIFLLIGFVWVFFAPIAGSLFLLAGLFILPIISSQIKIKSFLKYVVAIVLSISAFAALGYTIADLGEEQAHKKRKKKSNSTEYALEVLTEMNDSVYNKLKRDSLEIKYFQKEDLNKNFLSLLKENSHKRDSLLEENRNKKINDSLNKITKAEEKAIAERDEIIQKQFSSWNGAHRNLENLIQKNMNDPDSYEHIKTVYFDKGDHLIVITSFRGKNAFNATIKNSITAKVDLNGNVIEVIDQ